MLSLLLAAFVHHAVAAPNDWQGEYVLHQSTDADEEKWSASLSISECGVTKCRYSFLSGSAQSSCGAEGEFKFKTETKAESKQGASCTVQLERRKSGHVFVDADGECNDLCGAQGARYFAVELSKISSVKFFRPSFSCTDTKLSKIETAVCTSEKLAKLDVELSTLVDKKKAAASVVKSQREWLKARNKTCAKAETACLEGSYNARIKDLSK